tara:strand:+ start:9070 stop:9243 length:174 start_codon:yes stop_codon:yes gene_type:complete
MLHIKNFKNIEHALKLLKSKVIRTKQKRELNNRRYFKKPSAVKREQFLKAKFVQKKK